MNLSLLDLNFKSKKCIDWGNLRTRKTCMAFPIRIPFTKKIKNNAPPTLTFHVESIHFVKKE